MTRIHKLLRDEDFERAVLLMRAGRACWPDSQCFGAQDIQPEDELLLMKEIYLTDLASGESQSSKEFLINFPFPGALIKGRGMKKCFRPFAG
jgi:timeless